VALHLLSAARLAADLADGRVGPRAQAAYLAFSFVIWLVPVTFHIAVAPARFDAFGKAVWFGEFFALLAVNFIGAFYCLRQCRVEPGRHFMVDCSCLMVPVTVVALAVTWLGFYAALGLAGQWWPQAWSIERFEHFHDALTFIVVVGQMAWIYRRVGKYMATTAQLRSSALVPPAAAVTLG
jgi:hypothetical protein